jgi:ketosteroid isomerase-like protein
VRRLAPALALAACLAPGLAAAGDREDVVATLDAFHAALAAGDSRGALALLADDTIIAEAGELETLAQYRDHHLAADIAFARAVPVRRQPPRVTVQGDVAWAVSTSEASGTFRERSVDVAGAELAVLTRTLSGWRIRAVHWSSR